MKKKPHLQEFIVETSDHEDEKTILKDLFGTTEEE